MDSNLSPIGLIAGEGKFPLLFAQEARKNRRELIVIAIKEEANEDFTPYARTIHTISVSKLDKIIQSLKKEGVKEAVMAGRVHHTQIFSDLIPDFRAAKLLFKIKDRRADSILGAVADEFKKDNIKLLPSTTFLSHLIPPPGMLTKGKLSESQSRNVEFGIRMAQGLSALDLGQTVVVKKRSVVAIEAIEGTDECIRRAGKLVDGNVLVIKSAKPNQDLRFDVPIVGLNTIKVMREARAVVLAVQAHKTLMLDKDQCVQEANDHKIHILAW